MMGKVNRSEVEKGKMNFWNGMLARISDLLFLKPQINTVLYRKAYIRNTICEINI